MASDASNASPPIRSGRPEEPDAARFAILAAGAIGAIFAVAALVLFGGRTALGVAIGAVIAVVNLVMLSAILRAMFEPVQEEADREAAAAAAAKESPGDAPEPARVHADHAGAGRRGGAAWGGFAVLKMIFLFGGVWILLTRGWVDPIPLVVGYGVLPLGITTSGLFSSLFPGLSRKPGRPPR